MAGNLSLSVSQLNEYVRRMFQLDPMLGRIDLKGEISNLKFHQSGMLFFTMKDDQASIACVMNEASAGCLGAEPFEGMRAVVSGSVGLYARGGRYQFYAVSIHPQGMGVLYERLIALKEKLSSEGLFDPARKKTIPCFADTVGVVSSPTGAVIHDILNVSLRRDANARILLCPARVQGIGAADEVIRAIHLLERMDHVGVIILARGGGSMEDLWTFNEESVVRAVAACKKPIVSAIGHETDVTLCDLAADLRVPTPSAAAECVISRRDELEARIHALHDGLRTAALTRIEQEQTALSLHAVRLAAQRPKAHLERETQRLALLKKQLTVSMEQAVLTVQDRLAAKTRELELLSPYGVLARGYAIVQRSGSVVECAADLHEGDRVTLRFADGSVGARVNEAQSREDSNAHGR